MSSPFDLSAPGDDVRRTSQPGTRAGHRSAEAAQGSRAPAEVTRPTRPERARWPRTVLWEDVVGAALVALGIALRLREYVVDRTFQVDEALIGLNLLTRDAGGLLGRLDNNQAAPAAWLEVEKLAGWALGYDPYVLRAPALAAGIVSVVAFWVLCRRVLGPRAALVPVAALSFSSPLIVYSSIVKSYELDVAAAVLLYLVALPFLRGDRGRPVVAAILGGAAVLLSFGSYFVVAGIGAAIVLRAVVADRAAFRRSAAVAAAWAACVGVSYALATSSIGQVQSSIAGGDSGVVETGAESEARSEVSERLRESAYLFGLRDGQSGRVTVPSTDLAGGLTVAEAVVPLCLVVAAAGFVLLLRREPFLAAALGLPGLFVVAAAAIGAYPLFTRTLLFLLPAAFLCLGVGAAAGVRAIVGPRRALRAAGALAVGGTAVFLAAAAITGGRVLVRPHPDWGLTPALAHVAEEARPGDKLYLLWLAQYGVRFYADCDCSDEGDAIESRWPLRRVPLEPDQRSSVLASNPPDMAVGRPPSEGGPTYEDQIDPLRPARRVWVVVNELPADERAELLRAFDARGTRLDVFAPPSSITDTYVYLYALAP